MNKNSSRTKNPGAVLQPDRPSKPIKFVPAERITPLKTRKRASRPNETLPVPVEGRGVCAQTELIGDEVRQARTDLPVKVPVNL